MKRFIKITAAVCAIAIILTIFAGCSSAYTAGTSPGGGKIGIPPDGGGSFSVDTGTGAYAVSDGETLSGRQVHIRKRGRECGPRGGRRFVNSAFRVRRQPEISLSMRYQSLL